MTADRRKEIIMSILEILLLGIGLSMDAFAVSICKGMACRQVHFSHMALAGVWFGGFQMIMPLIGYYLGRGFAGYIEKYDHWIAFALLAGIGLNMIREAVREDPEDNNDSFAPGTMLILAIATSIDALAAGLSLAFLNTGIWLAVCIIGVATFLFSACGVRIGSVFGGIFKSRAEIAGGVILIIIGTRILLTHLGVIS